MELTTRGRYAVMALAEIARSGTGQAMSLSSVADRQGISVAYLEQLFIALRRAGLVESARGRSGGYRLSRSADEITVAEIMVAVEERTRMTRCMDDDGQGCMGAERCLTHNLWHALGHHIRQFLSTISLGDVVSGRSLVQLPSFTAERSKVAADAGRPSA
ncbi:MAG: Rrf2 family transcriptional regulator [Hyphomicrobiaceae bacterium]